MFNRNRFTSHHPEYKSKINVGNKIKSLKTISVYSIDLEDCFNSVFKESEHKSGGDVLKANDNLIKLLADEASIAKFEKGILMSGFTGQSYWADRNILKLLETDSSFLGLTKLHKALQAVMLMPLKLDTFLLADMYNNQEYGYSFDIALKASDTNFSRSYDHLPAIRDRSKIIILYCQLHKLAAEHKDSMLSFNFYSSSKATDFSPLIQVFKQHAELIPANVILRLNLYENDKITLLESIMGKGEIDFNFKENIKKIDDRVPDRYDNTMDRSNPVNRNFDFAKFITARVLSVEKPHAKEIYFYENHKFA